MATLSRELEKIQILFRTKKKKDGFTWTPVNRTGYRQILADLVPNRASHWPILFSEVPISFSIFFRSFFFQLVGRNTFPVFRARKNHRAFYRRL